MQHITSVVFDTGWGELVTVGVEHESTTPKYPIVLKIKVDGEEKDVWLTPVDARAIGNTLITAAGTAEAEVA